MKKNLLLKVLLWLVFIFFVSITSIGYFFTDGYRNYKDYCSEFIPNLEYYYKEHHEYPKTLLQLQGGKTGFNFRYSTNDCGYSASKDSYTFFYSEGFGVGGYDSKTNRWWVD